jgi:hypothetical protein
MDPATTSTAARAPPAMTARRATHLLPPAPCRRVTLPNDDADPTIMPLEAAAHDAMWHPFCFLVHCRVVHTGRLLAPPPSLRLVPVTERFLACFARVAPTPGQVAARAGICGRGKTQNNPDFCGLLTQRY